MKIIEMFIGSTFRLAELLLRFALQLLIASLKGLAKAIVGIFAMAADRRKVQIIRPKSRNGRLYRERRRPRKDKPWQKTLH